MKKKDELKKFENASEIEQIQSEQNLEEEQKDISIEIENRDETTILLEENAITENNLSNESKKDIASKLKKIGKVVAGFFATLGRWIARMFMGASKSLVKKNKKGNDGDKFLVEEITSPTKQTVQSFFHRPTAVIALCVLIGMFLFAFIGRASMKTYTDESRTITHKNIEPNYKMLAVKKEMSNDVKDISSRSFFTSCLMN